MGFKDYGFGYRNVILMREHSGNFILGEIMVKFSICMVYTVILHCTSRTKAIEKYLEARA
jgi:hypothetical protein